MGIRPECVDRYRGRDRRTESRPVAAERRRVTESAGNGGRLLLGLLGALMLAVSLPFVLAQVLDETTLAAVARGTGSITTALFVAGGLANLLRWRLVGEAPVAVVGIALLVYGAGIGLFVPLGPSLVGAEPSPVASSGIVRAAISSVVIYLLLRSLRAPTVDSRLRPLRRVLVSLVGLGALFAGTGWLAEGGARWSTGADQMTYVLLFLGWATAAVHFVRRGAVRLQTDVLWIGLSVGSLAVASLLRAAAAGHSAAGMLAGATVSCAAGAVAVFGAGTQLTTQLVSLGQERLRLQVDLVTREGQQEARQARQEDRLHDVRSTLAAVRIAAGTLQRYDARLEATQRESLQTAVTAELVRLERLIDPPPGDVPQLLDLDAVLGAVVETERIQGSAIEVRLRHRAFACPDDVVAIVQNLLVNARRHAPGTGVRITSGYRDGVVEVRVADGGPGIPPEDRDLVFERGRRGPASAGSGIGLFVARQLAVAQGGSLTAHERVGGGTIFLLRLPSAAPQALVDEVQDVLEPTQHERGRAPWRDQQRRLRGAGRKPQEVGAVDVVLPRQRDHVDHVARGLA